MNFSNNIMLQKAAVLGLAALSLSFASAEFLTQQQSLLGYVLSAFMVALVFYSFQVLREGSPAQRALVRAHELEQVKQALDTHCLISVVDEDRRIVDVNDRLLEALGYSRDEVIGRDPVEFEAEAKPVQPEQIQDSMMRHEPWAGEIKLRRKDGSILWTQTTIYPRYDRHGHFVGSISVRTDITESKIAVAEREALSILNKLRDSVYIFDPHTYEFSYLNDHAMRRHGWAPQVYAAKTVADTAPQFDIKRFGKLVQPLLDGEVTEVTTRVDLTDGPHEVSVQLITTERGTKSFVAVLRDISDRLQVEEIKDQFISTVSHELRSPITSIKGALGLLTSQAVFDLPANATKLIDIAHRNSDRLASLVNDILDLEKISAGRMKFDFAEEDLNQIVGEAIEMNAGVAVSNEVTVSFDPAPQRCIAKVDASRLQQALTNLISNAAKFSRPGGKVSISVKPKDRGYKIDISDQGAGIPETDIKKIFDRFHQAGNQASSRSGGTGLGLSIVKAIVQKHDGDVSVSSTVGKGSTFSILLPDMTGGSAARARA